MAICLYNQAMSSAKETIRFEAIKHRAKISVFDDLEDPEKACDLFFDIFKDVSGKVIATYWPKEHEFDVRYILEHALKRGAKCALPVVEKDCKILKFYEWSEQTSLVKGAFNVMQPDTQTAPELEPDIVIVPLLAFDLRGNRIGYGGGYYDATLADLRTRKPDIDAVGVCFAAQAVIFKLPTEDHDEKLDWVITPQKVHRFKD